VYAEAAIQLRELVKLELFLKLLFDKLISIFLQVTFQWQKSVLRHPPLHLQFTISTKVNMILPYLDVSV
jgi:hypothetical protein